MHLRAYKNRVRLCWMKFVLNQAFRPTFSGSSNQIFMMNAFEYSFIQHLVYHHCAECKSYAVECVSNVFIDIRMSIVCGVPQKITRRKDCKQDQREEARLVSKREKDSNARKDWTEDKISLPIDILKTSAFAYGTCILIIH